MKEQSQREGVEKNISVCKQDNYRMSRFLGWKNADIDEKGYFSEVDMGLSRRIYPYKTNV
jgi:hypothetical protein